MDTLKAFYTGEKLAKRAFDEIHFDDLIESSEDQLRSLIYGNMNFIVDSDPYYRVFRNCIKYAGRKRPALAEAHGNGMAAGIKDCLQFAKEVRAVVALAKEEAAL